MGLPAADVSASIERALRLGGSQPTIAYVAGYLYDRVALTEEADDAFVSALVAAPSLAADVSWLADPAMAARFPSLVDEACERAGVGGWQIALMAGDSGRARVLSQTGSDLRVADRRDHRRMGW